MLMSALTKDEFDKALEAAWELPLPVIYASEETLAFMHKAVAEQEKWDVPLKAENLFPWMRADT